MLSYLSSKKADDGYTRKKLLNPVNTIVRTDVNPGEMDVEEVENTSVECLPSQGLFIPPLPKDNIPPPPPPEESDDSESQSPEDVPETSNVRVFTFIIYLINLHSYFLKLHDHN